MTVLTGEIEKIIFSKIKWLGFEEMLHWVQFIKSLSYAALFKGFKMSVHVYCWDYIIKCFIWLTKISATEGYCWRATHFLKDGLETTQKWLTGTTPQDDLGLWMNGHTSMMRFHDKLEIILDCTKPFQIQQNRTFNAIYLHFWYAEKFQHFPYIYVIFYSTGPEQID